MLTLRRARWPAGPWTASEATRRQVEEFPRGRVGAPALRYLAVTGTRGPSGARNLGWRSAKAEIIAFTDDDCIALPGWLASEPLSASWQLRCYRSRSRRFSLVSNHSIR